MKLFGFSYGFTYFVFRKSYRLNPLCNIFSVPIQELHIASENVAMETVGHVNVEIVFAAAMANINIFTKNIGFVDFKKFDLANISTK